MTQEAINNAKVLYRLGATRQEADELRELYELTPELLKVLTSPVISIHKKDAVIEKIYQDAGLSKVLVNYTKMMCRLGYIGEIEDILDAFYLYWDRQNHILRAELTCAGTPQPEEEAEARKILAEKYPDCEIVLTEKEDENLLGGYIIKVHHKEYDRSYEVPLTSVGKKINREVKPVGAISAADIISIIQSEIEEFDWDESSRETGSVIWVGDGIATIYGIDHAMYGEIVVFDNGVKGMVQDIRQNEIGVILFGT